MERSQINSPILAIMELVNLVSVPMSLKAVIQLKVLDTIRQDGSNNPLSPAEISYLPSRLALARDAENLQRILRLLTSYGVFNEHIGADGSERRYDICISVRSYLLILVFTVYLSIHSLTYMQAYTHTHTYIHI